MRERQNTRSSLFLIELILAILFFSLASAVCIQVFVKAHFMSQSAKELTLGSSYASSAAEVLAHTDGSYEAVKALLPEAMETDGINLPVLRPKRGNLRPEGRSLLSLY